VKYEEAIQSRQLLTDRQQSVRLVANVDTRQFATYLYAHGAIEGIGYELSSTTFGGLRTGLGEPAQSDEAVIVIVVFDDVFPELGYRSMELWTQEQVMQRITEAPQRIEQFSTWLTAELSRWTAPAVVVPPLIGPPPLIAARPMRATPLHAAALRLQATLAERLVQLPNVALLNVWTILQGLGAAEQHSAGTWLHTGSPLSLALSDRVAANAHQLLGRAQYPKKVLVTDADDTLWHGVLGDDGPAQISAHPDGPGWIHHVYQSVLSLLRSQGALLAISSRGELEALQAFASDPRQCERAGVRLPLEAFSAVQCSWGAKSSMLRQIAEDLGVSLEGFVFIDDNCVELAEVQAQLPMVTAVQFPRPTELDTFVQTLRGLFANDWSTKEDLRRADLYQMRECAERDRQRFQTLEGFLRQLDMVAQFDVVTSEDEARPLQLLNKTNQFNLTGERLSQGAWQRYFHSDNRCCVQGQLRDRHGDHGIVLVALIQIDPQKLIIENLAVSCRVLHRGYETAFLDWLTRRFPGMSKIEARWYDTARNGVARAWLTDHGFIAGNDPGRLELSVSGNAFELPRHHLSF
jgi:FkbH-like protein